MTGEAKGEERREAPAAGIPEGVPCCAPGCSCGAAPGNRRVKVVVSLVVLALVAGIVLFRVLGGPRATPGGAVSTDEGSKGMRWTPESSSASSNAGRMGEVLSSLRELEGATPFPDAVFVYIPHQRGEQIPQEALSAVLAAEQALDRNRLSVRSYTLDFDSPDREALSRQISTPAMLVADKGGRVALVSAELTASRLLQAYAALSRSGGCCPSPGGSSPCP